MSTSLFNQYAGLVAGGHLEADARQEAVLARLEELRLALACAGQPRAIGPFSWLKSSSRQEERIRGVYLWGRAGSGKTMRMDLFYAAAPGCRKTRAHFHEFMAGIHAFLHEWRSGKRKDAPQDDDPAAAAAESIARNTSLLCFDEFSVTDIADAMILGRLFAALFARGIVIVATTNVRPDLLYKDGINRALFLPFVAMIEEKMEILRLDARTDFRLEKLAAQTVYFTPADETARTALTRAFKSLTGAEQGSPVRLRVLERELTIGEALDHAARSTFAELCENPLGPADFLAVAQNFHTVFVDAIPVIPAERRDVTKRFITLIDALYDWRVKLIASAAAEPARLYSGRGRPYPVRVQENSFEAHGNALAGLSRLAARERFRPGPNCTMQP